MKTIKAVFIGAAVIIFFVAGVFCGVSGAEEITIIANKSVPADSVSARTVKKIFLGKTTQWGNGEPISFAVTKTEPVYRVMLSKYLRKSKKTVYKLLETDDLHRERHGPEIR